MSRTARESSAVWPEGVIARHLTKAAEITGDSTITVDVTETGDEVRAVCRGCGADRLNSIAYSNVTVVPWARAHAESCRALPRPEGS
ncbi:hypothetical protein ABZ545_01435 [Streptomyces abikoensis]|uniref:hypothetical protein n=1 Tax=Streptomyces abikoensis TaxID=97398 RepID=UPI0033F36F19